MLGRTALKWLASVGAGGLTTLVLALVVLFSNIDMTSARGAALVTLVGTVCSWVAGWAVSKRGPQPPKARAVRKPRAAPVTGNGPNFPPDFDPTKK
jgi:cobalamin synthase